MSNADEEVKSSIHVCALHRWEASFNIPRPVIITLSRGHLSKFYDLHTEFTELCDTMSSNGNQACKNDTLNLEQ